MKIIYAGFPKTGTKTMNEALTILGYECYDYMENYMYLGKDWSKIFREGGTKEDFRRMFENVDACMDVPSCYFWEEIHEAFPDAKIIFSERSSEDAWWKSFQAQWAANQQITIKLMQYLSPSFYRMNNYGLAMCRCVFGLDLSDRFFWPAPKNELIFRKAYRTHNTYVMEKAPKDNLLVINYAEGWEPLCKFLGCPVPDVPFPHKNKNANITNEMLATNKFIIRMQQEMMVTGSLLVCLMGYGVYRWITRPAGSASLFSYLTSSADYIRNQIGR